MSKALKAKTTALGPEAVLAEFETLIDDERTRITRWRIAPGAQTGWHRHEWDYVTIQQSGGRLALEDADGHVRHIDYVEGQARSFTAPIEHNATNISDVEVRVIEIEYKQPRIL